MNSQSIASYEAYIVSSPSEIEKADLLEVSSYVHTELSGFVFVSFGIRRGGGGAVSTLADHSRDRWTSQQLIYQRGEDAGSLNRT